MTIIPFGFMKVVGAAELWTPDQITTIGWWDTSDTASITESGGAVSNVAEQKGGVPLLQTNGSLQPTTGTRTQNSLNVIDFDGSEDLRMTNNSSFAIAQPTNVSFISVHGVDVINNNSDGLWSTTSGGNDYVFESNINSEFRGEVVITNNSNHALSPQIARNGPSMYALRFSKTDLTVSSFVDGVSTGSTTSMSNNLGPACMVRLMVSKGTARVDGFWGEMVILNDDTTTTRQLLEGYLKWKWDLPALPSGHPYEFGPPTV
jgi:hypothetical protein